MNQGAYHYFMSGRVQGVGFRPYIYRLATQYGLAGWVKNLGGQVEIKVQGSLMALEAFAENLLQYAPPLARPQIMSCLPSLVDETLTSFQILSSEQEGSRYVHLPPDYFTCEACLGELHDPTDRRYRYPFINCTQCGPRYTLIYQLPYDRPQTSMASFELCPACLAEYHRPQDRRFHAQPIACPQCGPQLSFHHRDVEIHETASALSACVQALREGQIVAVKGIGGYHLLCVATNEVVVHQLRERKSRPSKPLAVMFPLSEDLLAQHVVLTSIEREVLLSPMRPIVLVRKRLHSNLSPSIAPGLTEVGIMFPYSPLHHLLLEELGMPVVATSANLSGEPVLTENEEVEHRLAHVAEAFLHHNRPIVRPADDSVFRVIAHVPRPLRLGRGYAPYEGSLPFEFASPLLALGAQLKNTIALGWKNRVVMSPHIGELNAPRSVDIFMQVIEDFQRLYRVQAKIIVCDAHPHYTTTHWARQSPFPVRQVFHHHAHASALAGEYASDPPWLIFTWDGVGLGEDGTLWGGEAFYGSPGRWQRVGSFRPFYLPGGEKAGREPWRSALALCWEIGHPWEGVSFNTELLHQAWQQRLNTPQTTAVGRLFDAAAALLGLVHTAHFEGQGPMALEARCVADYSLQVDLPIRINTLGIWETDWSPLVSFLLDERFSIEERATGFHQSIAQALVVQAQQICAQYSVGQVGLCGGVFQNRFLTEQVVTQLQENHFTVYLSQRFPVNDAGISFGQLMEAHAKGWDAY